MKLTELVDISELRELSESVTSFTGAPTAVLDLDGKILSATGWQSICTDFHRADPVTAMRCRESDTVLAGMLGKGERYNVYKCKNGLLDVAVPIIIGGEHVANLFTGQFFFEPPDQEYYIRQAEAIGFDKASYLEALNIVPILSEDKVRAMMVFFIRLAKLIGEMGLSRKTLQEANAELRQHRQNLEELVVERTAELSRTNRELQAEIAERKRAEEELQRQALKNEMLLRSASDGIHILDAKGNVLQANDVFCRMLGYTRDEALKLNVSQWDVRWSDRELETEIMPRLLEHPQVFETKHRRRNGQILDVEVSATGVEIGGERMLFASSRDITERKQMEEMLRTREEKIEGILIGAPVGIAVLVNRTLSVVNDRFCETVAYSREELIGMSTRELYLSDESYEQTGNQFYTESSDKTGAETQFRRKDGRVIDVLITMAPMQRHNPRAEATFMVMDITERKRAEQELKRYAAELFEANRLKDIFTDVLRHDILNPVTAITTATQLLLMKESDAMKTKLLQKMRQSTENLLEMTENAAKLAAVTAGQALEFSPADPVQVLRSVLPDFEHKLKEKNITLADHSGGGFSASLHLVMQDVFANLVSNAIKYSPDGSHIDIDVEDRGDSWGFCVKDQGAGVPKEYKQKIFNRFERLNKEGVKGSGLGLTITKQIISLHGGEIWVEDNPSGGSIFFVSLPKMPGASS